MEQDNSIDVSTLHTGQKFDSFPALCRYLDQPVKGNRKSQEKDFWKYFEWEKADRGNGLIITKKRERPIKKWLNPASKFDKHILIALSNQIDDGQPHTFSSSSLLAMCGLVSWRYVAVTKDIKLLEEYSSETEQTHRQALRIYSRLETYVRKYFWRDKIKEGLKRLSESGFIDYEEILIIVDELNKSREACFDEKCAYEDLCEKAKKELGVVGYVSLYSRNKLNKLCNERIHEEFDWSRVYTMQKVTYNPEISDPLVDMLNIDYQESLLEANSKALEMLGSPIDSAVSKEINKQLEGLSKADEDTKEIIKIFYSLSDYLNAGYGSRERRTEVRRALVEFLIERDPSCKPPTSAEARVEPQCLPYDILEEFGW